MNPDKALQRSSSADRNLCQLFKKNRKKSQYLSKTSNFDTRRSQSLDISKTLEKLSEKIRELNIGDNIKNFKNSIQAAESPSQKVQTVNQSITQQISD